MEPPADAQLLHMRRLALARSTSALRVLQIWQGRSTEWLSQRKDIGSPVITLPAIRTRVPSKWVIVDLESDEVYEARPNSTSDLEWRQILPRPDPIKEED